MSLETRTASSSAPTVRRVNFAEAIISFGLNQNQKAEISDYLKKYSVPSTHSAYPSWILFRATEVVLNFFGMLSAGRVQSKGKKLENVFQIRLNELAEQTLSSNDHITTTGLPGQQSFDVNQALRPIIKLRSLQLAHHLFSQFCSTAKINDQTGLTVKTEDRFTLDCYTDVLRGDKHALSVFGTVDINSKFWPY